MDKTLINRLAAAAEAHAGRRDAAYEFVRMGKDDDGEPAFYLAGSGETLDLDGFLAEVERRDTVVFVPLWFDDDHDDEAEAYWAERDANAPTWQDLQAENEWGSTPEHLRSPEPPAWTRTLPRDPEREAKAKRYEERLTIWDEFMEEMTARAEARLTKR